MKILDKKYNHQRVEKNKYNFWNEKKISRDLNGKYFSIILPPPNVTGMLHLGHAWDTTLQDLLIRYKKLQGYNVIWFPGMDHAGIATQTKVEQRLYKEKKLLRHDLGRERFIEQVWKWKEEYANKIYQQWNKLGLLLDYKYQKFTLDNDVSNLVKFVFCQLFNQKLIYRGYRVINWDPSQQTALSNIEVIHKEVKAKMYYFKYQLVNSNEYLVVATTRPETMFADQCLIVNPEDKRYQKFINQKVVNPANQEIIPIIADLYVDVNFGTGVMKCTPAHDFNDYELGIKHNLKQPVCLNLDGTMNDLAGKYQNLDRFKCREKLVNDLQKNNLLIKIGDHLTQIGYSERSNTIIEPLLSNQWFLKMDELVKKVKITQKGNNKINFFLERFEKILLQWMDKTQDWCISRQLWWGHQIPVWYHKKTNEIYVNENPPKDLENWRQDEDVLDTWFSSALWPMILTGWKSDDQLFDNYFPTSVIVTGYDIIFFWVSRMIFMSLYFTNKKPFTDVLIHGLIRDEQGQKMSKSLGNGIDPDDVINEYGVDSLRYFLLTNSAPGQDLRYSNQKLRSSWNFINKIWNASNFVLINLTDDLEVTNILKLNLNDSDQWILKKFNDIIIKITKHMDKYEFVIVNQYLFNFIWEDFCSWYIEFAKINLSNSNEQAIVTKQVLFYLLKQILIMIHPFMPFVSEEIYQSLPFAKSTILNENYPESLPLILEVKYYDLIINIVSVIREFRSTNGIAKSNKIQLIINSNNKSYSIYQNEINVIINKMINSEIIDGRQKLIEKEVVLVINDGTMSVIVESNFDKDLEKKLILEEITYVKNEILRSENILNNKQFLAKANREKVFQEKQKYENYKIQYEKLLDQFKK